MKQTVQIISEGESPTLSIKHAGNGFEYIG